VAALLLACAACDGGGGDPAAGVPSSRAVTVEPEAFPLGVASGEATADSIVLWTQTNRDGEVTVEVGPDDRFDVARLVPAQVDKDTGVVRAEVAELDAGDRYFYRFVVDGAASETGTFVTAPAENETRPLRFVIGGDSDGRRTPDGAPAWNEFEVLAAAAAEDADYFLYVGDTVYADREPVARTLEEYRAKYRENRSYIALRQLMASTATYAIWDDHEVQNDFAGRAVDAALLAAGRRAFGDYMPLGADGDAPLYRSFRLGRDVELIILDTRMYRSAPATVACRSGASVDPLPGVLLPGAPPGLGAARTIAGLPAELPPGCAETLLDAGRTMLGTEQLAWLNERLRASDATWKVVVTSVPIQGLLALPYDRWEGYAAERRAILELVRDEGIENVVFVATDMHANLFSPVRINQLGDEEPVAYEAVIGPIAARPLRGEIEDALGAGVAGAFEALLAGVVGVECQELESYSYGLLEVDGNTLTVSSKDAEGKVLCEKQLEAVGDER
jgi:alkaline phosphatase D